MTAIHKKNRKTEHLQFHDNWANSDVLMKIMCCDQKHQKKLPNEPCCEIVFSISQVFKLSPGCSHVKPQLLNKLPILWHTIWPKVCGRPNITLPPRVLFLFVFCCCNILQSSGFNHCIRCWRLVAGFAPIQTQEHVSTVDKHIYIHFI